MSDSGAELCETCGHEMDPHALVMLGEGPMSGGIGLCLQRDCGCWFTWSPAGVEPPEVPSVEAIEVLRRRLSQPG